ncbi:YybH family protein [Pontibacter akesuensis]|uniref:Ketosteroid isomerase homolog n=1 Tax=Pontibacter akesuensis TaxID=388950 RepID=A0A1I7JZU3_9BACT|nr:nuclear transport factor 2 family protein [Pontibacter akesuensis]GHA76223.1 hypothetical protein GCM10007389_32710 [Pontibacter akesuensis]SFU90659.1 Ketosteroid isomerase homolog [Pontibacter akesuensis]
MKNLLYIFAFAALLGSCTEKEDEVSVQELNNRFISAWNSNQYEQIDALLADDVQFVQGEVHFKGKNEVAERWVGETLGTITDLKTNVVSSGEDNKIAYEAGTFSVDVLPSGPDQPHGYGEGNFMLLWKKGEDGAWKLSYAQLEDLPVQIKN